MQRLDGRLIYAASDLNDYLECRRLTELEALVAQDRLERQGSDDLLAQLRRRKGEEHEKAHLERLRVFYPGDVVEFGRPENSVEAYRQAESETLAAMRHGTRVIYQPTFFDGQFIGHADFLRRVPVASDLGEYSYEVVDTKLGLNPKPYYVIQLCNYSEHLGRLQGRMPQFGHVVFGNGEERRFRLHDYVAYYRRLKRRFVEFAAGAELERGEPVEYPFECKHCAVCPWNDACERKRREDDHLSLVARIRRDQIAKLEGGEIARVQTLAVAPDDRRPSGMSPETFSKLRRQASLQVRGRTSPKPLYELLPHDPGLGFELLPAPAPGDAFFDMEGDPLYEPGRSLEYLFGCWMPDEAPEFRAFWALDREQEKRAFEAFVDFITERRRRYPAMHVYHYANYEKDALRRLAQVHSTREAEVDDLLRAEAFVDLFTVVRRALAISEESYSLKNFERFYDLERETVVKKGNESIVMFENWLLTGDRAILDDIERYNRDDCRSTHLLREWLLRLRAEAVATFGIDLSYRDAKAAKGEGPDEDEVRRSELERALCRNVLAPQGEEEYQLMAPDRRMRYLLANLLAYHRREEKPAWWAYFDRCDNVDQLLEFDKEAIAGLTLRDDIAPYGVAQSTVYTYRFPDQFYNMSAGDKAVNPRTKSGAGTILSIDDDRNLIELKSMASVEGARTVRELIPAGPLSTKVLRQALGRIATSFLEGTLERRHAATYDLLANRDPRLRCDSRVALGRVEGLQPEHVTPEAVSTVVAALDRSYLFIQGPPGSGKSTTGSKVICDLLVAGKSVAVTSMSHKAIHNLLGKVEQCMAERGERFRGLYKHSKTNPGSQYHSRLSSPMIESVDANAGFVAEDYRLAGGTAWLCAREELEDKFDYIFIDEAGQVSLADALAMSLCAKNVVLLGDPSQLAQVSQGSHPLHADDSVLQHLLGDAQTVSKHRGIFLDESYRMQPEICTFISDAMYDGRLHAAKAARMHRITTQRHEYAGLYLVGIEHAGNSSSSLEEASEIVRQVTLLLAQGSIVDSQPPSPGVGRKLCERDVIVVTPYNAQRRLIQQKLREDGIDVDAHTGVRVGTVDKFQGQEAAIVFYSMATSSGEDVPRNVEFLFERNRFNVAISRARAASVLVCSPRLLDIRCRTPEEMALANLLCSFEQRADSNSSAYTTKATVVP